MTDKVRYPALYEAASAASGSAQRSYFNLLKAEYSLLGIASIMALDLSDKPVYFVAYALIFLLSLATLLYRSSSKPEQAWYKCRALTESIKTSTWRYMMRAEPFSNEHSTPPPRSAFRNLLTSILDSNRHIGERIVGLPSADDQITAEMEGIRRLIFRERAAFYKEYRIREQRTWYTGKAGANKRQFRLWLTICVVVYIAAAGSVLYRIAYPHWGIWPTEPLIVFATSIVGWVQIKRYNELASAYTLTAHEIGIIYGLADEITTEEEFSSFVNEAELAFSREHTQWVARDIR